MKEVKTPWYSYYQGVKPHLDYPDISVYELFLQSANQYADNISYNYFGTKRTYKQCKEQIDACARALLALGIQENDAVSICMPNTPEAMISFYAINKIGAVANMIHPLSAEKEIQYFINLTKSKCIITIDLAFSKIHHIAKNTLLEHAILVSVKDSMPLGMKIGYQITKGRKVSVEKSKLCLSWKAFLAYGNARPDPSNYHFDGSKTAAILYSGGTTGYPKGIELTNLNFNALAMQGFEACGCLKEKDIVLSIMPVFHGFGLGICIHTVQFFGGTSVLLPQFSAKTFHKLLKTYRPNIIAGVPTLYEALLQNQSLEGYDLSFLKCVISGGDSLSVGLKHKIDAFLQAHGANLQVREGYGLTECVTGSCLTPETYYREGSIGIPYPDTYYKIVVPNTQEELPYGEEGEIVMSGPTVMKGYLNAPEENAMTLQTHEDGMLWLHTGDLGSMDQDGFIYFKQRLKRMIVSSGYNIYPQYIENTIDAHPDVLMSCVIGIEHPYKKQVAKAFLVLNKDGAQKDPDEVLASIRKHCEEQLAKYSWPYAYEIRDSLPKTLVGKVAYNELMEEEKNKCTLVS